MDACRGVLICFTGVDGSGKTTQAKQLVDWLQSTSLDARYVWSRGDDRWRRPLLSLGKAVLKAPSGNRPAGTAGSHYERYISRKSRFFKIPPARWSWGALVRAEHVLQIRSQVLPLLRAGAVVVTDRYIWDSAVDLAVAFQAGGRPMAGLQDRWARALVPLPEVTFYLDVPVETALSRKNDIPSREYISRRIGLYRSLADEQGMVHLDGCLDLGTLHAEVVRVSRVTLRERGLL